MIKPVVPKQISIYVSGLRRRLPTILWSVGHYSGAAISPGLMMMGPLGRIDCGVRIRVGAAITHSVDLCRHVDWRGDRT